MFASVLAYQMINLALAVLFVGSLRWLLRRRIERFVERRHWTFYRTPLRRFLCLEIPLIAAFISFPVLFGCGVCYSVFSSLCETMGVGLAISPFLLVGAGWYSGLVVAPVVGLWLALRRRNYGSTPRVDARTLRVDRVWAVGFATAALGFFSLCTWWEPNRIQVEHVRIGLENWPERAPPMRVAVLADVQSPWLGWRERRIPEIVRQLSPDLVVIPGDLVAQSFDENLPIECGRFIANNVEAQLGVFAVTGDVDRAVRGGLPRVLEGTPVSLIDNETSNLGTGVELSGFNPREPDGYHEALQRSGYGDVRIAVVHRPRYAEDLARAGYDLVIAGHTHGGQMVLPGFGPPITFSPLEREVAAGGLHDITQDCTLYVSRGIGTESGFAPPMRFLCPPEITLLELGPATSPEMSPQEEVARTASMSPMTPTRSSLPMPRNH